MSDPGTAAIVKTLETQRNYNASQWCIAERKLALLQVDYEAATKELAALKAKYEPPKEAEPPLAAKPKSNGKSLAA